MFQPSSLAFLRRLLDTPGPSGFEGAPARVWREEAAKFAQGVRPDVAGNSMAEVNPDGRPTVMLAGHIDEIGLIVTHIDGVVYGVVGKLPIHLMKPDAREKASQIPDLWVDIGARTRDEAEARLSVGDPGVIDSNTMEFPNNRLVSRSIDDRVGAFVVLEALRRYAEKPGAARVVAAATAQEEIAWRAGGALVCASCIGPQMAIVVDVTFATDHPGISKKEIGDHRLGGGPVLTRGSVISPVVFELLRTTARDCEIPFSIHAAGRDTSTDADAIHIAREGIATALVSIPNRYMHSPNEMISLDDLDRTASLIAESCRRVTVETDFTAR